MIEILIADNQTLTREGVKALLATMVDINIAASAAYPIELEKLINTYEPAVVLLDPYYSRRFTVDDVRHIMARYPHVRILILSNRQNREQIQEILDLGIKNYVFKECSREELVYAVYSTAKGEQFFCKNIFETLFGNKLIPEKADTLPQLSSRETELIYLIADGLTNNEIAEKLFLSVHTIKTHRKNIIRKLGFTFKNTAELAALLQKR
ncbi:response regulator transcription factor [Mucilaginibacter sp. UR6-11]|uniref:LuxR C-terminal-related transcriptional regulator n=1 Tax=Mucilaginibacter sp. UR6-11 TaxID=1435644 RepID=UPI001E453EDC|nr:response regulator transcription factor [Mucilaginibacter sp. UR6-11]MCC8424299.1 response regulator transcription factor [Mucilaginibacter sp. UR6-11]